ncbi:U1 snRNP protein [Batrachochytrium dendrobatidis]
MNSKNQQQPYRQNSHSELGDSANSNLMPLGYRDGHMQNPSHTIWKPPSVPAASPALTDTPSVWTAFKNPEGKPYYFNSVTQQSVWDKPDELKTPLELILDASHWKEYATPEGKKYYSNSETKETVWDLPAEIQEKLKKEMAVKEEVEKKEIEKNDKIPDPSGAAVLGLDTPQVAVAQIVLDFKTKEEAEEAFKKMLCETPGIDCTSSWESVIRKTYSKPYYRSLRTLAERKATFEKWCRDTRLAQSDARREKKEKDRAALIALFKSHPEITGNTPFATATFILAKEGDFANVEKEFRQLVYQEYTDKLVKTEQEAARELRRKNKEKAKAIFNELPITYKTTWKEAQAIMSEHGGFRADADLNAMEPVDILTVFEDHVITLDTAARHDRDTWQRAIRRKERKIRDDVRALLDELCSSGLIHAKAKWKDVYPHIKEDSRFNAILGQPGSTPLELFWDMICDLEGKYRFDKRVVGNYIKDNKIDITPKSKFDEFIKQHSSKLSQVNRSHLRYIFEDYQFKAFARIKEEKKNHERRLRKRMDAFKSLLKHLPGTPIKTDDEFSNIMSRVQGKPEYDALDASQRREVFDKYIVRLKENQSKGADPSDMDDIEDGEDIEDGDGEDDGKRRKISRNSRDRRQNYRSRRSRSISPRSSNGSVDGYRDRSRTVSSKRKNRSVSGSESDISDGHRSSSNYKKEKRSRHYDADHEERFSRSERSKRQDKARESSTEEEGELHA